MPIDRITNTTMLMTDLAKLIEKTRAEDGDEAVGPLVAYWLEEVAPQGGIPEEVASAIIVVVLGCVGFDPRSTDQNHNGG